MNLRTITGAWSRFTNGQGQTAKAENDAIKLDFPECVATEYRDVFRLCWTAANQVLSVIQESDLSALHRRSPALKGYDWSAYLRYSTVRMAKALTALQNRVRQPAKVLDLGSYFGNFSLMLAEAGFTVDAVDPYRVYEPAFDAGVRLMRASGIHVSELSETLPGDHYDAALLMGVIEHIPHTPRLVLDAVHQALRPGGYLIMDTPNLAYIY